VCPGSFDPVTNGHLDIVGRAALLYDEVVVAVFVNESKSSMFSVEERRAMLEEATAAYGNVRIDAFHGLIVAARAEASELVARDPELSAFPALAAELAVLQADERTSYLDKA
jgi:pantetheine-phosphate adenylyltransferase